MFNKLYEKLKNFIIENYIFIFFELIIIVILLYPVNYNIYSGGGTLDVSKKYTINNTKINGKYNLCYVEERKANVISYLLSFFMNWDIEKKTSLEKKDKDIILRDKIYLNMANNNAIYNAFKEANKNYKINYDYLTVMYIYNNETDLKVGDKIVSVDNILINNLDELNKYIEKKNINDLINIKVLDVNNKEHNRYIKVISINDNKKIGLVLENYIDIDTIPLVDLNFKSNELGPSGGFMLSLAIYDSLIETDLLKGRNVSGTGAIDINGNVLEIGGVKYKLKGAVKNKSSIFFVPEKNYLEAKKEKNKNKYNIKIVKVKTLEDAINYLKNN